MNWGWEAIIGEFLVETSRSELRDSLDTNVQGFELLPDDALRHTLAQFFTRRRAQRFSGIVMVWKLTPSPYQGNAAR